MALADDLQYYWKLDETSGDGLAATGGVDLSASGSHLLSAAGHIGANARVKTQTNSYLTTSDAGVMSLFGGSAWSLSMWWYCPAGGLVPFAMNATQLCLYNGGSTVYHYHSNGFTAGGTVSFNTWNHWAVTHDTAETYWTRYYFNGAEYVDSSNGTPNTNSAPLRLLEYTANSYWNADQRVSDLGLWDRQLSLSEVAELYNGGDGMTYEQITGGGAGGMSSSRLSQCASAIL